MNLSAPVEAGSKSPFAMDDQTSLDTKSFDSTFASSYLNSSIQITSNDNKNTIEMPNEDSYKPNTGLVRTFVSSDRPMQPAGTLRYVDQTATQSSTSNQAINSQRQDTRWNDESDRRTGPIDIMQSEHSSKQYAVHHDDLNTQSHDSGPNETSVNTNIMIQGRPVRKPVVSAEARSRWAMLAALAGVSKTNESEETEKSTETLNQTQQFATNSDYQIDEEERQEGRESGAADLQQSNATGMFGGLSHIVDMERMSHAQQEVEDVHSGGSAEYTASMEKYLQGLGNDPLIDSRGFTEGLQSFSRSEDRHIQDNQRIADKNPLTQELSSLEQSLDETLRGEKNACAEVDDATQTFQARDNTVASDLHSESYHAEGNVSQDAQQVGSEVVRGNGFNKNDLQTNERERGVNTGRNELEIDIMSDVKAVASGFRTGELAMEREFRSTEQFLGTALRSEEHILENKLQAGARKVKEELHESGLAQGIERVEQDLKDGLQMIAGEVVEAFEGRSPQGELQRGEHEVESVLQAGMHEVERGFEGTMLQDIRQGENSLKQDLRSGARKIEHVFASHGLEKDLRISEQELKGVLQGGMRKAGAEGSELLGDLSAGARKLEGSLHANSLGQHLQQGEQELKQVLHTGFQGLESALGGEPTPRRPTQDPARGGSVLSPGRALLGSTPAGTGPGTRPPIQQQGHVAPTRGGLAGSSGRSPSSSTLAGSGRGNMPLAHQQGPSVPARAGGVSGGMAPNSHVTGPHGSVPNAHGSGGPTLNALPSGRKTQQQGGPASNKPPSMAPQTTGTHGTPQQAQGVQTRLPSQKSGPTSTTQNPGPDQNSGNRQQPAPQKQQVVHQTPPSLQQNLPRPTRNAPPTAATAQSRPHMQQQPPPTNVNQGNQNDRQQTPQQPRQPISAMQHNQPRPAANAGQPNARPQLQQQMPTIGTNQPRPTATSARPQPQCLQNQQSQPQNSDQGQQENRQQKQQQPQQPIPIKQNNLHISGAGVSQPGAIPRAGWPQVQTSQSQNVNKSHQALPPLPEATAHSGPNKTSAQTNPAAGSSGTSQGQEEPVTCSHGEHEPRSWPHEQTAQTCQHQGHEAHLCPHKASAQLCCHKAHDPQSCPYQKDSLQGSQATCDHQGHGVASCPHQQKTEACDHMGHEASSCPHRRNALKCSHRPHKAKECPHEITDSIGFNQGSSLQQMNPQQSLSPQQQRVGQQNANLGQPTSAQQSDKGKQGLDSQQVTNSPPPFRGQQEMQRQQPQRSQQQVRPQKQKKPPQLADSQHRPAVEQQSSARQYNHYEEQSHSEQRSSTQEQTNSTDLIGQQEEASIHLDFEYHEESSHEHTSYDSEQQQQQPVPINPFQTLLATFAAQHQASTSPNPGFFERKFSPFPSSHPQPPILTISPFIKQRSRSRDFMCRVANRLPLNPSAYSNARSPHQNRRRRDAGGREEVGCESRYGGGRQDGRWEE